MVCLSVSPARFSSLFLPAVLVFLLAQLVKIAFVAQPVMATYHPTTSRALPLCHLFFQEPLHTILLYIFEVLYHAHMVKSAVALIEGLQMLAGEILAIMAKSHKSFPQQFTLLFVVTVLVPWQAAGAVCLPKPLLL